MNMEGVIFSIPDDDEVLMTEQPVRRFRPPPMEVREEPPIIPVMDEMPMDSYNFAMRQFPYNLPHGVNHTNMTLAFLMHQMNIHRPDTHPTHPYVPSWEELWWERQGGPGGSGAGGEDEY